MPFQRWCTHVYNSHLFQYVKRTTWDDWREQLETIRREFSQVKYAKGQKRQKGMRFYRYELVK